MPSPRDRRARITACALSIACPALFACRETPGDTARAVIRPVATPTAGDRFRYDPRRQPVFVAPDGSRRTIASMLALPGRMAFGDYAWRDLPATGAPIWVRVDLTRQLLSVFRGGDEIGVAVIVYGTDGLDTPTGIFPVRGKERLHRSRAYDADMPFTLWLTADGVAIHASLVERGQATHGCIGVPAGFAEKLFAVVQRSDTVIVVPVSTAT